MIPAHLDRLPPIGLPVGTAKYDFRPLTLAQKKAVCRFWLGGSKAGLAVEERFVSAREAKQLARQGLPVTRERWDASNQDGIHCEAQCWLRTTSGNILICYGRDEGSSMPRSSNAWLVEYRHRGRWAVRQLPSSDPPTSFTVVLCRDLLSPTRTVYVKDPQEVEHFIGPHRGQIKGSSERGKVDEDWVRLECYTAYWLDRRTALMGYYTMSHPKDNDVSYEITTGEMFHLTKGHWKQVDVGIAREGE